MSRLIIFPAALFVFSWLLSPVAAAVGDNTVDGGVVAAAAAGARVSGGCDRRQRTAMAAALWVVEGSESVWTDDRWL